jgi:hypothetical protein
MVLMPFPGVSTWFSCLFPGSPHGSHVFSRGLHTLPLCRFLPLMLVLMVSTCYHSVGSFLPWQWFFLIRKVSFPRSLFFPSVLLLTILDLSPFSLGPPEVIQDILLKIPRPNPVCDNGLKLVAELPHKGMHPDYLAATI